MKCASEARYEFAVGVKCQVIHYLAGPLLCSQSGNATCRDCQYFFGFLCVLMRSSRKRGDPAMHDGPSGTRFVLGSCGKPIRYLVSASDHDFDINSSPRSGELRTQKLKSHSLRTQSLKVLPLKPGVGKCIATYATLTARDFFLPNFYPSGPFTGIFFFSPQNLYQDFPVLAVANTSSCVDPQNKIGHPAYRYRQLVQVPVLSACGILIGSKTCVIVFMGLYSEIVAII